MDVDLNIVPHPVVQDNLQYHVTGIAWNEDIVSQVSSSSHTY